jgi:hypothetical protein
MNVTKHRLTISFPVSLYSDEGPDLLAAVPQVFGADTWSDGRYDYARELSTDGLSRIVRQAVFQAVLTHFEGIHGRSTLEDYGPGCRRNVAHARADDWMREHFGQADVSCGDWQASIAPDDSER